MNKANVLNDRQKAALWGKLKELEAELSQEQPTFTVLAERLSKELGFSVTARNLKHCADNGFITWKTRRKDSRAALTGEVVERISKLEQQVGSMDAKLKNIVADLDRQQTLLKAVCQDFGVKEESNGI